ncbi:MAG: hypothetical protein P1V97_39220, partial [Planctomycetota bacterium]|nr:hypothetical protein [Planctomycetota bacterium]
MTVELLQKEILKVGRYVDQNGQEIILTVENIAAFLEGSEQLLVNHFRINGFPDHETVNSKERLGRWVKFWQDENGSGRGLFDPKDEKARKLALENDASAVLWEGFDLGEEQIDFCMPRIDIVPQGAVIGTEPFKPAGLMLSANTKKGRARVLSSIKEYPMKSRLAKLLSQKLMGEAVEDEDSIVQVLKDHLMTSRGLTSEGIEFGDDDLSEALVEMLSAKLMPEGADADEGDESDEAPEDDEAESEEGEEEEALQASAKLSGSRSSGKESRMVAALQSQLREIQADQLGAEIEKAKDVTAKTSPIPRNVLSAIRADYKKDHKAFGHKPAL